MVPIDTMLQKGHSSYQKYHLTKMALKINDTSQKWCLTTYITGFSEVLPTPLLIEPTPLQLDTRE